MSESWDDYAEGWDDNADVVLYADKAYASLCQALNPESLDILDFGCGTGLLTERLSRKANRILALDSSDKMITVLKNKQLANVKVLAAELSDRAIKSNPALHSKFDLIVASSVCAFLPDYTASLLLLKRLLKPEGIFVQWDWLKTQQDSDFGFTEDMIESTFLKAGLDVISITKAYSLESEQGVMPVLMGIAKKA